MLTYTRRNRNLNGECVTLDEGAEYVDAHNRKKVIVLWADEILMEAPYEMRGECEVPEDCTDPLKRHCLMKFALEYN